MGFPIVGAIILGVSIVIGIGSRFIFKKKDHPIEEIAEKIIKEQTGIDVDFTPENGEKNKEIKEETKKPKVKK